MGGGEKRRDGNEDKDVNRGSIKGPCVDLEILGVKNPPTFFALKVEFTEV